MKPYPDDYAERRAFKAGDGQPNRSVRNGHTFAPRSRKFVRLVVKREKPEGAK